MQCLTTIHGGLWLNSWTAQTASTSPLASIPCPPLIAQHLPSLSLLLPLLHFPGPARSSLWNPCPASPSQQMWVKAQTSARHSVELSLVFPRVTLEMDAFILRKILQKGFFASQAQILFQSEDMEAVGS